MQKKTKTGLARALSKLGHCSRSQAAELVRTGHVALNGRRALDPEAPVRLEHDHIAVDGVPIEARPKLYLVMNKPRGLVTTASDEVGRATVYHLLQSTAAPATDWVGPVGRLDKASEGLLLFTNDSKWAATITDPDSHLVKRYHVQIACVAEDDLLARIRRGVHSGDEHLSVKAAQIVRTGRKNSWLEIALEGGKNRQIRRLLEGLGVQVLRLVRVSIGPLELGALKKGTVRPLTDEEMGLIDEALRSGKGSTPGSTSWV